MRHHHAWFIPLLVLMLLALPPRAGAQEATPPSSDTPVADLTITLAPADDTTLDRGLTITGVGSWARRPINRDAVVAAVVAGTGVGSAAARPRAGDVLVLPEGVRTADAPAPTWKVAHAGADGGFAELASGSYVLVVVRAQQPVVMMLRASGHTMVYANGEPRMGDPYAHGFMQLPVKLHAGENTLLFACSGRAPLRATLAKPKADIFALDADWTKPDLVAGEPNEVLLGIPIVNATEQAKTVSIVVDQPAGDVPTTSTTTLSPLSVTKVPVPAASANDLEPGQVVAMTVTINDVQIPVDTLVKDRLATHSRVFRSEIDASVQYVTIVPPQPPPAGYGSARESERPGLVLSLHGASVEATSQAASYSPKENLLIACPTNRRPYGFDWEDWGRIDAIEAMNMVRLLYQTHPRRQYLTGHSMGGHGTWQLGVLYPDRFAAIAPSAGWLSFDSYMTALGQPTTNPGEGEIANTFRAATRASDTPSQFESLRGRGVTILHGDADDNVPVSEARAAKAALEKLNISFEYHEQPGAGHWWDGDASPGADCVDWPPIFEFFHKHQLDVDAPNTRAPQDGQYLDARGFPRGSFKRAFDKNFLLVYATRGTADENAQSYAKARYDSEQWWYRANGFAHVVADVDVLRTNPTCNLILYGNADINAAWSLIDPSSPQSMLMVRRGGVQLSERSFEGDDLGVLAVLPRAPVAGSSERYEIGIVAGTGVVGARALDRFPYFLAGVGVPERAIVRAAIWSRGINAVELALARTNTVETRKEGVVTVTESYFIPNATLNPEKDIVSIAPALGLAEITARVPNGLDQSPFVLELQLFMQDGTPHITVPMIEREQTKGVTFYTARVLAGSPTLRFQLRVRAGPTTTTWPVEPLEHRLEDPTPAVPTWAMGATWYQIFPERFRNGEPANDPRGPKVFQPAWNSNWYEVQPGEFEAWQARDPRRQRADVPIHKQGKLYNVIWDRRYGGDLQGIVQKLDEIQDLGVTAIYMNPIFAAESLHKYDASDFRHIDARLAQPAEAGPAPTQDGTYSPPPGETADPKTWTWTPADRYFVDIFLPECKRRGIRVILDGVWNHTGREFWAFQDIVKQGKSSPYASWFQCEFDNEGKLVSWTGWPGRKNGELPEFRQVKGNGRDWDQTVERGDLNAGIKEHIFAVTKRWMDPNGDGNPSDGIDGWRLDVAGEVGEEFWRDWRELVKQLNPQALIVAEIWSKVDGLGASSGFDTQMHYPFAYPVLEWLTNQGVRDAGKQRGPVVGSQQLSMRLRDAFTDGPQTNLIHQNLFASHDTDRYVNILFNPGRFYDRDCAEQNGDHKPRDNDPAYIPYKPGKPDERAFKLSLLGVAIQATYEGAPMVYYGDEVGMWGSDDPTCRKPHPWPDAGTPMNPDDAPIQELREQYKSWLRLRQDPELGPALKYGSVRHLDAGSPDVFAFERQLNEKTVLVVINRGENAFDAAALRRGTTSESRVAPLSARVWLQPPGPQR
jgi:glycosidase/predicted peptidase